MRYRGKSFFFCLGASFRLGMGRHPPQHFYVQYILSLFHLSLSPLASVLSPTYRMLFFTQNSSFFFSLFQLKVRNGNTKIKSCKIASRDKILSNYFTTFKNCFRFITLVALRLKVYYVFLVPTHKSGYPDRAKTYSVLNADLW